MKFGTHEITIIKKSISNNKLVNYNIFNTFVLKDLNKSIMLALFNNFVEYILNFEYST